MLNFQDHVEQNNDQMFPEALFGSRLNVFLFSIYFLIKHKQEIDTYFIYGVWYLFLSII